MNDAAFDAAVAEAVRLEDAEQKVSALYRLRRSVLKERRLLRVLTIVSIVLACGAIGVGVDAHQTADTAQEATRKAQRALDAIVVARNESRVASCNNANVIAHKHNDLTQGVEDTLRTIASPTTPRTPEQQARVDAFLAQQITHYESIKIGIRDCSLEGIEKFQAENKEPS